MVNGRYDQSVSDIILLSYVSITICEISLLAHLYSTDSFTGGEQQLGCNCNVCGRALVCIKFCRKVSWITKLRKN